MSQWKIIPITGVLLSISLTSHFGCGSTKPSRFYVLTPVPNQEERAAAHQSRPDISVRIGLLGFPDHLLHPQIAIQTGSNKLEYAEYDRWAEPLNDNFARVLAENISKMIPTENVYIYPWKSSLKVQYQVNVEVIRFAQGPDRNITLIAFWSLFDNATAEQLLRRKSTLSQPGPGSDPVNYGTVVETMSRLVEDLSREIVTEIKEISQK